MSIYMGDSTYWRNEVNTNEDSVDKEQESTGAPEELVLDDSNHLSNEYPAVQSYVEDWEDGIVVRTMPGNSPTLVEFSFSTGEGSTEGEAASVVEQEEVSFEFGGKDEM